MLTLEEFKKIKLNDEFENVIVNPFNKGQTKTTQLFMQIMGFQPEKMPKNFINAYINDKNKDLEFDVLVLLFYIPDVDEYHDEKKWQEFHTYCTQNENFYAFYTNGIINNKNTVCFSYTIPDNLINELIKFFNGKYSEYNIESKNKFIKFYEKDGILIESLINQILYKKERLRLSWEKTLSELDGYSLTSVSLDENAELWQKPIVYEERLNDSKL